jgi:UDP-glucose 4-epimerase
MKILFTGASSFSGMWFVKELAQAGHSVTACLRSPYESYSGLRKARIDLAAENCRFVFNCPFGSDVFLEVIEKEKEWNLFCHHAADVTHYKSPDFNVASALTSNTLNLKNILTSLQKKNCNRVLLTGSVFEQREGAGSDGLRAVSPYGLSKGLTTDVFEFYTSWLGMRLGKFVIPNPFGPYEEVRFTTYLVQSWYEGKCPLVSSPDYVRDNIHVSLLAKAYAYFAERLEETPGFEKFNPSGYPESQGAFTERFAREMRLRLEIPCEIELRRQVDFPEPKVRINVDVLNSYPLKWDESKAWDDLAYFYQKVYGSANV